jgi:hypothetical protein
MSLFSTLLELELEKGTYATEGAEEVGHHVGFQLVAWRGLLRIMLVDTGLRLLVKTRKIKSKSNIIWKFYWILVFLEEEVFGTADPPMVGAFL